MWTTVALDEMVEAPMTMPGMRTRCEIFVAFRSRMEICVAEECSRSW